MLLGRPRPTCVRLAEGQAKKPGRRSYVRSHPIMYVGSPNQSMDGVTSLDPARLIEDRKAESIHS